MSERNKIRWRNLPKDKKVEYQNKVKEHKMKRLANKTEEQREQERLARNIKERDRQRLRRAKQRHNP